MTFIKYLKESADFKHKKYKYVSSIYDNSRDTYDVIFKGKAPEDVIPFFELKIAQDGYEPIELEDNGNGTFTVYFDGDA
jgi:hypothetical protein|tara:strand:+ start:235 stop:471 length:237 start_codon:yes stop_codon:yes gene_type:complete